MIVRNVNIYKSLYNKSKTNRLLYTQIFYFVIGYKFVLWYTSCVVTQKLTHARFFNIRERIKVRSIKFVNPSYYYRKARRIL